MTFSTVMNIAALIFLLTGAFLCLAAATGIVRFPDLLTRMHSATKPQSLGLLLILIGLGLRLRDPGAIGMLTLVAIAQLMTAPVAAHMVGRAAYRTGHIREDLLDRDELRDALDQAGSASKDRTE